MNTIFYILIYITAVCPFTLGNTLTLENSWRGGEYKTSCYSSDVQVKVVDSIDELLANKNASITANFYPKDPDKIIKVTLKDGKYIQKEVKIVPITKRIKRTIEQEQEVIEGYEIR